jgi:hypothetical protein
MERKGSIVLGVGTFVLLAALGLILVRDRFNQEQRFKGEVKELLPAQTDLPDWQLTYAPIADSPEMQKRVLDILDYDDAIYAIYTKGEVRISVYLAYWKPGKMPVRSVARHTPDVCWTLAGWECTMREELDSQAIGGRRIGHTESRSFKIQGQTEHVAFWHLAGDEIISYRTGGRPPWYAAVDEFVRWGNQFKQEQFFFRISSNRALPEFMDTEVLRSIVRKSPFLFGTP